jgi:hypothetical protein
MVSFREIAGRRPPIWRGRLKVTINEASELARFIL